MTPVLTASIESRRRFLRQAAVAGTAFLTIPGLYADALMQTPAQTEGPFYPKALPLDTDNDLLMVNDTLTPAAGVVTYVSGRILDGRGDPVRNALVEIWQCDDHGVYLHPGSDNGANRDKNFQGFGRFLTGSTGEYLFRTIRPVPYPGRAPHIHYKVKRGGKDLLTTQCYIKGHPGNAQDGIWKNIQDPKVRELVTVEFAPLPGARAGEQAARFDVVLGVTPEA